MKSHVIVGCFVLLQPLVPFAAQTIVQPDDAPRAAAPRTETGTQSAVPKKPARTRDAEVAKKGPGHVVQPADRQARSGSSRGLTDPLDPPRRIIDPSDTPRRIIEPSDKPSRIVEPADTVPGRMAWSKPRKSEDLAGIQRADRASAADSRRAIEGGSFGAPSFAKGESTSGAGVRWIAPGDLPAAFRTAVPPATPRPGPESRPEQGTASRSGEMHTPGFAGQSREIEDAHATAPAGAGPHVLRDVKLSGMDYRHFAARGVAECSQACAVEGQCRSWTLRPARRNNTYDNGDDGPVCWLKSGTPQREYARGYASGIKPAPPSVGRDLPPPPVVQR